MNVIYAGKTREYPEGTTVAELLKIEEVQNARYASVAINDVFASISAYDITELHEGDVVEVLYLMGGGQPWRR